MSYTAAAHAAVGEGAAEGDMQLPCPPHHMRNVLTGECIKVEGAESIVIPAGRVQGKDFLKDHIAKFYTKVMLYYMDKYQDMATILPYYMVSPHPYFYALRWKYTGKPSESPATASFVPATARRRWQMLAPPVFSTFMDNAMANPAIKTIVLVISIDGMTPKWRHSNAVFIHKGQRFIERFEPNTVAEKPRGNVYLGNGEQLDEALKELFAKWTEGYEYVPPMLTCPLGFHAVDCLEREESTKDKGGNCTDWSLWWMDLRLANADRPREELIGYAIEELRRGGSFRHFINGYIDFLTRISKKYKGSQRAIIAKREVC